MASFLKEQSSDTLMPEEYNIDIINLFLMSKAQSIIIDTSLGVKNVLRVSSRFGTGISSGFIVL